MKTRFTKILSFALAAGLILSAANPLTVKATSAEDDGGSIFIDLPEVKLSEMDVTYDIHRWDSGALVQFNVKNAADKKYNRWLVLVPKEDYVIDSYWCAHLEENGRFYIFTALDWNKDLEPGESATFGFTLNGTISDEIIFVAD